MYSNKVSLNFFAFEPQDFDFEIYRKEFKGEKRKDFPTDNIFTKKKMPVTNDQNKDDWQHYWITFNPTKRFEKFTCNSRLNPYLTLDFIYYRIFEKIKAESLLIIPQNSFRRVICIKIASHKEGDETIWIEPYYLKSIGQFGILLDFEFKKLKSILFSREVQRLSLSLNKYYLVNKDFYIDKYSKIKFFFENYLIKIFPINLNNGIDLDVIKTLVAIQAKFLKIKKYIIASNNESNSQFKGVKDFGPLQALNTIDIKYFFIFHESFKSYANGLVKALRGETYKYTFSGMEKMFKLPFRRENIEGFTLKDYKIEEVENIKKRIENENTEKKIVIFIHPKENSDFYYRMKNKFIKIGIPTQGVTIELLKNADVLKWSASSIGLQIFAKLGGKPWKVKPSNNKCLILGLGQAHKIVKENGRNIIEKFFSYSVLIDSSGLYIDLDVLGKTDKQEEYFKQISENLEKILKKHHEKFDKFVIHAPFKIKHEEIEIIKDTIKKLLCEDTLSEKEFVVLKVNTENKFFGYNIDINSLVPYESTYIKLSNKEYLVWFEGLQFHNTKTLKRYSGPIHIEFRYTNKELTTTEKIAYLQDVLNLSGANWRGFNAKSSPVSIYYPHLVSRFIKEFRDRSLPEISISNLPPWFL